MSRFVIYFMLLIPSGHINQFWIIDKSKILLSVALKKDNITDVSNSRDNFEIKLIHHNDFLIGIPKKDAFK